MENAASRLRQIIHSVIELDDGYILSMKNTAHTYELNRIILMKINKSGDTIWTKAHFTDSTVVFTNPPEIFPTDDGHFMLAGMKSPPQTQEDKGFLFQFDETGEILWEKTFGENGSEGFIDFKKTPDGGYIMGGYSYSVDPEGDFYLVKTDAQGEIEWESHLGGPGYQSGYSVDFTPDGGYVISGRAGIPQFPFDVDIAADL